MDLDIHGEDMVKICMQLGVSLLAAQKQSFLGMPSLTYYASFTYVYIYI